MNDAGLNDDAELDAFLAGKGALSELLSELKDELQAELPQPSADLEAKIMADAQAALTPTSSLPPFPPRQLTPMEEFAAFTNKVATMGPPPMQRNPVTRLGKSLVAANDAMVNDGPAAWPEARWRWLWRWRVPLGVAASVLLFFPVVFKLSQEPQESQESPMSATPALKMAVETATPTAAQANRAQDAAQTANAPAPPAPPAALADSELAKEVRITNKAMKKSASPEADAQALLTAIEKMILNKKIPEALEAWQKFRLAYPDYVVTPALEKQMEALKAQQ